jgi:hypothetical protein
MMRFGTLMSSLLTASLLASAGCGLDDGALSEGSQALQFAGTSLVGDGPCAAVDQLDADCPSAIAWDNHGQYVSCVARYTEARVTAGDLTLEQKDALVSAAAQSDVGKRNRRAGGGAPDWASIASVVCP